MLPLRLLKLAVTVLALAAGVGGKECGVDELFASTQFAVVFSRAFLTLSRHKNKALFTETMEPWFTDDLKYFTLVNYPEVSGWYSKEEFFYTGTATLGTYAETLLNITTGYFIAARPGPNAAYDCTDTGFKVYTPSTSVMMSYTNRTSQFAYDDITEFRKVDGRYLCSYYYVDNSVIVSDMVIPPTLFAS